MSIKSIIRAIQKRGLGDNAVSTMEDRAASQQRQKIRRSLARDWNLNGLSTKRRIQAKRAIKKISRRGKVYNADVKLGKKEEALLHRRMRESKVLNNLFPSRLSAGGWQLLKDRDPSKDVIIDLEKFSFLDDPQATLNGFKQIAEAEALAAGAKINFQDKYCLDVSPYMLLTEIWHRMMPVFEGGKMDIPVQKALAAVGVLQEMNIGVAGLSDLEDVWSFPLERRRAAGESRSRTREIDAQRREVVIDQFCDAVDDWFDKIDMELTGHGRGWIKNILGELLENAERHSDGDRRDGTWSLSGFMARRQETSGSWTFHVRLGILNLGDTFSESLKRAMPETSDSIDKYVDAMKLKGAVQSVETLRTLAGLQDGVTCVPEVDRDGRGGYGLQEMLELVSELGATEVEDWKPRVTIISGGACIQLRHPYIMGERKDDANGARVLWCNDLNSIEVVPDPSYVYDLNVPLPGTAISIGFTLDEQYYNPADSGGHSDGIDKS